MANRRGKQLLRQIHRRMAIMVARAYLTVLHTAATILVGMPSRSFMHKCTPRYIGVHAISVGMVLTKETKAALRLQARRRMMEEWNEHLSDPRETSGKRVVEAIRRERTAQCHHCDDDQDTAQHTVEYCQAWVQERRVLVDIVGNNLSLPGIIAAMLRDERSWMVVSSFCETVMSQKEGAERKKERFPNSGRTPSQGGRAGTGRGRRRRPLSRIQEPRSQTRPTGAPNPRGAS
ncbi:reverse transcriptase [Lasius niger]|uniref:Reverse transcriptase n=1 Tax=Lasius niger TaxID=67767 RepID=A0A0J7KQU9_LASNI|nr:reverse transcriptase [Lasius niger]